MLSDFVNMIKAVASSQPIVNSIIDNDIYRLNSLKDAEYSVFGWQQRQHQEEVDFWIYSFQFFYIDRLTQDGGNELQAQSTGMEVLSNIIGTILGLGGGDIELASTTLYQPFTQKFKDETAGCYATVTFRVAKDTICYEEYVC